MNDEAWPQGSHPTQFWFELKYIVKSNLVSIELTSTGGNSRRAQHCYLLFMHHSVLHS